MTEAGTKITTMEQCAERIIELARQRLDTELPELQSVIWLMPAERHGAYSLNSYLSEAFAGSPALWTDGEKLFYDPQLAALEYRQDKSAIARLLLHILTHGLLGHFQSCYGKKPALFGAAADLEVTDFLLRYARPYLRLSGGRETRELLELQRGGTAEQICEAMVESGASEARIARLTAPLRADAHVWLTPPGVENGRTARWAEAARLTALNLSDAERDDLAERVERWL